MQRKWPLNLLTALVWTLAGASAVYWGLRMAEAAFVPLPETELVAQAGSVATRQADMARLLGASTAETAGPAAGAGERFTLAGVVASATGEGVALISTDGKPARPFAVGTTIAPGYVLKSVGRREAMLAGTNDGGVSMTLALPAGRSAAAVPPLSTLPASNPVAPANAGVQPPPALRGVQHGPQ